MSELHEGDQVRIVRVHHEEDVHLLGKRGDLVAIHPEASDGDFYSVRLDSGRFEGSTLFFWRDELEKADAATSPPFQPPEPESDDNRCGFYEEEMR